MKKNLILAVALTLGAMTAVSAKSVEKAQESNKITVAVIAQDTTVKNDTVVQQVADEFKAIKFEELNEKVQTTIRGLVEKYDLNALHFNAKRQITKLKTTLKSDKTEKTFYFDAEGKEIEYDESQKSQEK